MTWPTVATPEVVGAPVSTGGAVITKVSVLELPGVALAPKVMLPPSFPVTVSTATPLLAARLPNPVTEPAPAVLVNVTSKLLSAPLVTVFPPASSIVAVSSLIAPEARLVVMLERVNWEAAPTVVSKTLETADVRLPSVAVRVYPVAALSSLQPPKSATPLLAPNGFVGQDRLAPTAPVPRVILNVTLLLSDVKMFPLASSTLTTG